MEAFLSSHWWNALAYELCWSVGKQMKNNGLDMLIKTAFAGVDKMLIGKKFTMNVRALRVVVIELL